MSGLIEVVGGIYREQCISPRSDEVYGSAGRAALALTALGCPAFLHGYFDEQTRDVFEQHRAWTEKLELRVSPINKAGRFLYRHWLATPTIFEPSTPASAIEVRADSVLRFGMLEGEAVVQAKRAVYDPQNTKSPKRFFDNGSVADELALVLNEFQARSLVGEAPLLELVERLLKMGEAQVVVIKRGPFGALVAAGSDRWSVPAYLSEQVWKIGSGDHFAAHFAYQWLHRNLPPHEAADLASRATANYASNRGILLDEHSLFEKPRQPISISPRVLAGYRPTVYLAGPFFTLAQRWLVDEVRDQLHSMRLNVFSPIHDVGDDGESSELASKDLAAIDASDALFAIADGFDPGTVFEVGYARAKNKPVVVYAENEKERHFTMLDGSGCYRCSDFVSAIYHTVWSSIAT